MDIRDNCYKLLIFVEGLSAHLQYEVRKAGPGTYDQAKQLARNIEAAQKQQASKSTAALSGISQHPDDTSSTTLSHQLTNLQHQFQQMQASLSRLESQRSNPPPSPPFHAPSSFHSAYQTSSRSNNRGNYQNFSNRGQTNFQNNRFQRNRLPNSQHNSYQSSPGVTICSRCHKRGHTAPNCFRRTQNQSFAPNRIAYAVDPTVQRREGLRSNTEKLAPALLNLFDKNQ